MIRCKQTALFLTLVLILGASLTACSKWHEKYGIRKANELNDPATAPKLVRAFERGDCNDVYMASYHLHSLGAKPAEALDSLVKQLNGPCGSSMLYYVPLVLGRLGAPALPALKAAIHHAKPEKRLLAISGLGEMRDQAAEASHLLAEKILSKDQLDLDWSVPGAALDALGKLGPAGRQGEQAVLSMLLDESWRIQALDCLVKIGDPSPRALETLKVLSQNADNDKFREKALKAYKKLHIKALAQGSQVAVAGVNNMPVANKIDMPVSAKNVIVAVFEIQDKSKATTEEELDQLTLFLSNQMTRAAGYKVIPHAQLQQRLRQEKKGSFKKCYDEGCQIELGRALSAQKSLSTQLIKVGKQCQLAATLFDLKNETTDKAASVKTDCSADKLLEAVEELAKQFN